MLKAIDELELELNQLHKEYFLERTSEWKKKIEDQMISTKNKINRILREAQGDLFYEF